MRCHGRFYFRKWLPDAAAIASLFLLIFIVYGHSLSNDFVSWDDHAYLLKNRFVWGITWTNVAHNFSTFLQGNYHPLTLLTYMVEYAGSGLNPFLYKFDNLLLHALCSTLIYLFLCLLGFERRISLLATLIFALHPLRVESVAWVTGRKDLLCAFFSLLAMVAQLKFAQSGKRVFYIATLLLLPLALLSKGTALVLPWALLLVDYLCGRRIDRRALYEKIPHILIAGIFVIVAIYARSAYQETLNENFSDLFNLSANAGYRLCFYYLLRIFYILPHTFPLYPPPAELAGWAMAGFAGIILLIVCGWKLRDKFSQEGIGLLFYSSMLVPALPLENLGYWADRFTYFPAVGLAIFFAGLLTKIFAGRSVQSRVALVLLLLVISALALSTYRRSMVWRNSISLWSEAVAEYSGRPGLEVRLARAYLDRGRTWLEMKDLRTAEADFRKAVSIAPQEPLLMLEDLAEYSLSSGDYAVAAELFTIVVERNDASLAARIGRASAYYLAGERKKALADLLVAEKLAPENPETQNALAICYMALGERKKALNALTRLLSLEPNNEMAKKMINEIVESAGPFE